LAMSESDVLVGSSNEVTITWENMFYKLLYIRTVSISD